MFCQTFCKQGYLSHTVKPSCLLPRRAVTAEQSCQCVNKQLQGICWGWGAAGQCSCTSPQLGGQVFAFALGSHMTDTLMGVCSCVPPQNVPRSREKPPGKRMIQQRLFRVCLPLASSTQHIPAPAKHFVEVNQSDPPAPSREVGQKDPATRGRRPQPCARPCLGKMQSILSSCSTAITLGDLLSPGLKRLLLGLGQICCLEMGVMPRTAQGDRGSFIATLCCFLPKLSKSNQTNQYCPGPQTTKSPYGELRQFLGMGKSCFKEGITLCLNSSPKATCAFQPKLGRCWAWRQLLELK